MTDNNSETGTKRLRRATRYQKAQERRHQHAASDNKFYAAMFSIMTILAPVSYTHLTLPTTPYV